MRRAGAGCGGAEDASRGTEGFRAGVRRSGRHPTRVVGRELDSVPAMNHLRHWYGPVGVEVGRKSGPPARRTALTGSVAVVCRGAGPARSCALAGTGGRPGIHCRGHACGGSRWAASKLPHRDRVLDAGHGCEARVVGRDDRRELGAQLIVTADAVTARHPGCRRRLCRVRRCRCGLRGCGVGWAVRGCDGHGLLQRFPGNS